MTMEISAKAGDMRTASINEASSLLKQLAGSRRPDESLKAVFRRIGRRLPAWSDNRVRDVWRCDPRVRVRAEEVEQLRLLVGTREEEARLRDELAELRSTIARFESYIPLLERIDAGFHSETLSATRHQLGEASRLLGKGGV